MTSTTEMETIMAEQRANYTKTMVAAVTTAMTLSIAAFSFVLTREARLVTVERRQELLLDTAKDLRDRYARIQDWQFDVLLRIQRIEDDRDEP